MRLYELREQYQRLSDLLMETMDDDGGVDAGIAGCLQTCEGDIREKLGAYCRIIRNLEACRDAMKSEAERLRIKSTRLDFAVNRMKDEIKFTLEACGESKIQCDEIFTVRIQASPPSLDVTDLSLVPTRFDVPQPRKIDTKAIKDLIASGGSVPGCEIHRGTHVRIV